MKNQNHFQPNDSGMWIDISIFSIKAIECRNDKYDQTIVSMAIVENVTEI
jgi:hypothetical protein